MSKKSQSSKSSKKHSTPSDDELATLLAKMKNCLYSFVEQVHSNPSPDLGATRSAHTVCSEEAGTSASGKRGCILDSAGLYTIFDTTEDFDDAFYLRFLRAREFDFGASNTMMQAYLHWRIFTHPHGIQAREVITEIHSGKCYCHFRDKQGRPVIVGRFRYHWKSRPLDATLKLLVFALDGAVLECKKVPGVHQFVVLVDLDKYGYENVDMSALKGVIQTLDHYYPERLGQFWFVHAGVIFMTLWKMIRPFVPTRTSEKIHFYSEGEYKQKLKELIDEQVLPEAYGGKAPTPEQNFIGDLSPPGLKHLVASTMTSMAPVPTATATTSSTSLQRQGYSSTSVGNSSLHPPCTQAVDCNSASTSTAVAATTFTNPTIYSF